MLDCIKDYQTGEIITPKPGSVFTPYVRLAVAGENILLTGNDSSPISPINRAVITSLQYGTSAGTGACGAKIEITDEGGVVYRKIFHALNKTINNDPSENAKDKCKLTFGWVVSSCDGTKEMIVNDTKTWREGGGQVALQIMSMTTTFEGNLIKFIIEATDLFVNSSNTRLEKNIGTEDGTVDLKTAIRQTFTEKSPKFSKVDFLNAAMDEKKEFDFTNKDGGKRGYKSVHTLDQESNISCTRKWLNQTETAGGKGCLIMYNPHDCSCVILEDPAENAKSLGTYVVNGGNNSPVISFNPTLKWFMGSNAGKGGASSGSSSGDCGIKPVGENDKDKKTGIEPAGGQTALGNPQSGKLWRDNNEATERGNETHTKNYDANKVYEVADTISAELKIFGNPHLVNPLFLTAKFISIVVINPYYVNECTWISESNCNSILSNKNWIVLGADHQITSGQYVTTLKVSLPAPGINVGKDEPIGGTGSNGEVVTGETWDGRHAETF